MPSVALPVACSVCHTTCCPFHLLCCLFCVSRCVTCTAYCATIAPCRVSPVQHVAPPISHAACCAACHAVCHVVCRPHNVSCRPSPILCVAPCVACATFHAVHCPCHVLHHMSPTQCIAPPIACTMCCAMCCLLSSFVSTDRSMRCDYDSSAVSVILSFCLVASFGRPFVPWDCSGQLRLRCPCSWHLKHRPLASKCFFSSGVICLKVFDLVLASLVSTTSMSMASGSLSCLFLPLD